MFLRISNDIHSLKLVFNSNIFQFSRNKRPKVQFYHIFDIPISKYTHN